MHSAKSKTFLACGWLLACWLTTEGAAHAADRPWIEIDTAATTAFRQKGTGKPFVPVGVNYFDPDSGWAPKLWHTFDEARARQQLTLVRGQGFNTIRVFLTLDSFHREPGQVFEAGKSRFRRLLAICRDLGIYVIPTGPDHWEGTPSWRKGDPFADEEILEADEAWWKSFAAAFKDEPGILAWDLLNEPAITWNSPAMRSKWNAWLAREYGGAETIAAAWAMNAAQVGALGAIAIPPNKPAPGDQRLFDYQRFREHIGDEWTRRLTSAIRSVDRRHLITIGHVQWAVPIFLPTVWHYAGFDVKSNARHLDFVTIHFYPLASPRPCDAPDGIAANATYLEALLYLCTTDKPLMIGEFGWYGGGELRIDGRVEYPAKDQEHQTAWCKELLDVSRGRAAGWLNWAFADAPLARDLSRWSGCWTETLSLKPWGRVFADFAAEAAIKPHTPRPFPAYLTSFQFDRKALLTSPKTGDRYRDALRRR